MRKETKKETESIVWAAVDLNEICPAVDPFQFIYTLPAYEVKANGWKVIEFADKLYLDQKYNQQYTKMWLESGTTLDDIWDLINKNINKYNDFFTLLFRSDYYDIKREIASLIERIKKQIDCTKCANCCKISLALTKEELKQIATFLNISKYEVFSWFKKEENGRSIAKGCPFLENNLCTIYKVRPKLCRKFPNIDKISAFSRLNHAICPIIHNAVEEYKPILLKKLEETKKDESRILLFGSSN